MASQKLFKTFSNELIKSLNIQLKRKYFYYDDENEKCELVENKVDPLATNLKVVKLDDANRQWIEFRKSHSLFFDLEIKLENVVNIFHGKTQACDSKTKLGIGLSWKALNSKFKYCIKLGSIDDYIDDFETTIEGIEVKCPDSDIEFSWFIYVIKPGNSSQNDGYANAEGMIVAVENAWTIMVSGNGSIFPIEEYSKQGDPLWHTRVDFIDWTEDEFSSDNLAIVLNPAHPLFQLIDSESPEFNENILKEVLSSALTSLIVEIMIVAKENGNDDALFKEQIEARGSILSAVRYFKDTLGFAVDKRPSELETTIKKFFDKEKKICK